VAGPKNHRTRSSLQIDEFLKVDLPADTLAHVHQHGLNLAQLRYLLITHSHSDHICASEVEYLFEPFAKPARAEAVRVFGNKESMALIRGQLGERLNDNPALVNEIEPFAPLSLPLYNVTPVRAHHGADTHPLNYVIERDGSSLLYACDTGFYEEATWEFLSDHTVDLVISECTEGPRDATYGTHMGLPNVEDFRDRARDIGLVENDTPWVLTHFSHGGGLLHEELEELAEPMGFTVAWDGMELVV
jgi:phosphoribosyl 1,2-cyclic phosphate phosphodiesterase